MNDFAIFVIGTAVFMLTIGACFVSLLASDYPEEQPVLPVKSTRTDK